MAELARLGLVVETQGGDQAIRTLDQLTASSGAAERATDQLATSARRGSGATQSLGATASMTARLMSEFARGLYEGATEAIREARAVDQAAASNTRFATTAQSAGRAASSAAADFNTFYNAAQRDFVGAYVRGSNAFIKGSTASARAARLQSHELVNLSRQFTDVGVSMAMGMPIWTVAIQQGTQIADVFAIARARGVGFAGVVSQISEAARPLMRVLGPVAIAAGATGAAFGLLHRELAKGYPDDLTKGLGLTEAQLERVEQKTVTFGDTFMATLTVVGRHIMDGPVGEGIDWLNEKWNAWLDDIGKNTVAEIANITGAFVGGYSAVRAVWGALPAALGDIAITTANMVLRAINAMIERSTALINGLIEKANAGAKAVGLSAAIPMLSGGRVSEIDNPHRGAAARAGEDVGKAYSDGFAKGVAGVRKQLNDLGKEIGDEGKARRIRAIFEQAGKAAAARDKAAGGRGGRSAAEDARQIRAADEYIKRLHEEIALIGKTEQEQRKLQIARAIADAPLARQKELIRLLGEEREAVIALTEARQLLDSYAERNRDRTMTGAQQAERQARIDLAKAEATGVADIIEQTRIATEVEVEWARATEIANTEITDTVTALNEAAEAVRDYWSVARRLTEAFDIADQAASGVDQIYYAFKHRDWMGAAQGLVRAYEAIKRAMAMPRSQGGGLGMGLATAASALGPMIGGRFGSVLSGAGSGFMLGNAIMPGIGGIVGGLLGGIGGLFSANKQRRQERRAREQAAAEEAAARAMEIANQRREIEIRLLELSGDKVAATARARQAEINAADASLRPMLEQLHAAEDAAMRRDFLVEAEIHHLELAGDAIGALNRRRAEELKLLDAALRPIQEAINTVETAAAAVDRAREVLRRALEADIGAAAQKLQAAQERVSAARDRLNRAYETESARLQDVIDTFGQFRDGLRDFRRELEAGAFSDLSPENAYTAAKGQFSDVSRRAALGDQEAMGQFADTGRSFIEASQAYNGLSPQFFADQAAVLDATKAAEATAGRTLENARSQLDALNRMVGQFLDLNQTTGSISDAIAELQSAEAAQAQAQTELDALQAQLTALDAINGSVLSVAEATRQLGAAQDAHAAAVQALGEAIRAMPPPVVNVNIPEQERYSAAGSYAGYVQGNPDLMALFNSGGGMARGRSMEEFGLYHWANYGQKEGRQVRPFAQGGSFRVGGAGGTDSQEVRFRASPDERVTVETPEQMARQAAAQERAAEAAEKLGAKLDALLYEAKADKAQQAAIAKATVGKLHEVVEGLEDVKRKVGSAA